MTKYGDEYVRQNRLTQLIALADKCEAYYIYSVSLAKTILIALQVEESFTNDCTPINNRAKVDKTTVNEVQVMPNPASNLIQVISKQSIAGVTLMDIQGQEIWNRDNINTTQTTINISNIQGGVYHLKVTDQIGETILKRIVIIQ